MSSCPTSWKINPRIPNVMMEDFLSSASEIQLTVMNLENAMSNYPIMLNAAKSKMKSLRYLIILRVLTLNVLTTIGRNARITNGGINQINVSNTSGVSTLKKNGEINTISMENPSRVIIKHFYQIRSIS